jgi:hypothetical protein
MGGLCFEFEIDEWLNDFDALRAASITLRKIKSITPGSAHTRDSLSEFGISHYPFAIIH